MKKSILALAAAAALIVLLVVLPYFFGAHIEKVYRREIESLSMPGSFVVEVAEYKRGWFDSEAKVLLTLVVPDSAMSSDPDTAQEVGKLTRFVVQDVIHHGPVPITKAFAGESGPYLGLAVFDSALFFQEEPILFSQFFGQSALVTARTSVGFLGGFKGWVVGQKLVYKAPDGSFSIDWKGFDGRYTFADDHLKGSLEGDGLDLGSADNRFQLFRYVTDFDYVRHVTGTYVGSQTVKLDGADATLMGNSVGGMKNFAYTAKTGMEGTLLSGEGEASLEKVDLVGESLGPGRIVMRLSKLDMPSYLRFNDSFQAAVRKFVEAAVSGEEDKTIPPDLLSLIDAEGRKALGELLKNSPVVEIPVVSLKTPEGEISGRMKVTWQGQRPAPEKLTDLVRGLVFDFELKVPAALAKKIAAAQAREEALMRLLRDNPNEFPNPKEVDRMAEYLATRTVGTVVKLGIMKREGETLTMAGGMMDGKFKLNGKEYHVPLD